MATYYDSSLLLAMLLDQPEGEKATAFWDSERQRVSSILLEAESVVVLRRFAQSLETPRENAAIKLRWEKLNGYLTFITLREVDRSVLDALWKTTELAQCRTLDAIHLATALLFQQQLDEPLRICSLDKRMREQALKLKFKVAPE